MKILIIGDIGIVFTYEFIIKIALKIPNAKVDILNFSPRNDKNKERENKLKQAGCKIFYQPKYKGLRSLRILHPFIRIFEFIRYRICKNYDIINIHYIGIDACNVLYFAQKNAKIIASIYGSDLFRAGKLMQKVLLKVFNRANVVTVASKYVYAYMSNQYEGKYDSKIILARYGSVAAEYIHNHIKTLDPIACKKEIGVPVDKYVILCGYNGSKAQRQIEIIDELNKLPVLYREKIFLLFQCSYGASPDHLSAIAEKLKNSGFDGKIVTNFMSGIELAKFRKCVDIFLNMQPTDVLSATMIEELEAGAIVINGKWLRYPDLEDLGAYLLSIQKIEDLPYTMIEILENYTVHKKMTAKNEGLWKLLCWEEEYPNWKKIITN